MGPPQMAQGLSNDMPAMLPHSHRLVEPTHSAAAVGLWSLGQGCWSCRPRFSLYDLVVVSDEQIQKWADEAEAGYDVAELKRRGRGRPGRGAEPAQVVAVRLTAEELEALDAAAKRQDLSRSEAIRTALAHFAA